jgi:hypothetical protein
MFFDGFIHAPDALLALSKLQGGLSVGSASGRTFFVDSNDDAALDQSGRGTLYAPFATLAFALGLDEVEAGDTIILKEGHTETLTADLDTGNDQAGLSIVGLGVTTNRPTLTISGNFTINMNAGGQTLRNLILKYDTAGIDAVVTLNAAGSVIRQCSFRPASDIAADYLINVGSQDDTLILDCDAKLQDITTAALAAVRFGASADRLTVRGCMFTGNYTNAVIEGDAGAPVDVSIAHNALSNSQTTAIDGIIDLNSGTKGFIAYNGGKHGNTASLNNAIDAASCAAIENYFQNTDGESGGITPSTRST